MKGEGEGRTENGDAFAILRSVVRAYCVGDQRGRQNVKCGRIARWEREIEQKRGRGKKLNSRDFIGALPTATVSFWRAIPGEDTSENQEFAHIRATAATTRQSLPLHERQWNIHKSARILMIKIDLRNSGYRWSDARKCVHYRLRFHGWMDVSISKALRDVNAVLHGNYAVRNSNITGEKSAFWQNNEWSNVRSNVEVKF